MDVGIFFFVILEIGGPGRIENIVHKNMLTVMWQPFYVTTILCDNHFCQHLLNTQSMLSFPILIRTLSDEERATRMMVKCLVSILPWHWTYIPKEGRLRVKYRRSLNKFLSLKFIPFIVETNILQFFFLNRNSNLVQQLSQMKDYEFNKNLFIFLSKHASLHDNNESQHAIG
jgi:hypothetical protein